MIDATGRPFDPGDGDLFADRDPVAAVRELMQMSLLLTTPSTRLAGDDVVDPA